MLYPLPIQEHVFARRALKLHLGRLQYWSGGRGGCNVFNVGGGFRANNFGNDCNSNTNPNTHSNIGRHLGISLLCISFSHLPLLDPTNMAADGYNFCGLHTTGWNYSIYNFYRDQLSSSNFDNVTSSAIWSGKILRGREPRWLYIVPLVSGFAPYLRQQACVPSSLPAILLFDQVYFSTTSFHFSLFLHVVKKFLDGWRLLRTSTCCRMQSNSVTAL